MLIEQRAAETKEGCERAMLAVLLKALPREDDPLDDDITDLDLSAA